MIKKYDREKPVPLADFKAYLRFKNIPYKELASVINTTIQTFSDKINNVKGREFDQGEIYSIGQYLNLSGEEIVKYFFPGYLRNAS